MDAQSVAAEEQNQGAQHEQQRVEDRQPREEEFERQAELADAPQRGLMGWGRDIELLYRHDRLSFNSAIFDSRKNFLYNRNKVENNSIADEWLVRRRGLPRLRLRRRRAA